MHKSNIMAFILLSLFRWLNEKLMSIDYHELSENLIVLCRKYSPMVPSEYFCVDPLIDTNSS